MHLDIYKSHPLGKKCTLLFTMQTGKHTHYLALLIGCSHRISTFQMLIFPTITEHGKAVVGVTSEMHIFILTEPFCFLYRKRI